MANRWLLIPTTGAHLFLFCFFLLSAFPCESAWRYNGTGRWKTLSGANPLVVARGGFSGVFPDSSLQAYKMALQLSVPDVILWCDVQLTNDGVGICLPDLKLENSTDIAYVYSDRYKLYLVNGVPSRGWFSFNFTHEDLKVVNLNQGIYSRSSKFDSNNYGILTVQQVAGLSPPGLWLNIQHDLFFSLQNLSMKSFVVSISKTINISYISSTEVNFLRNIYSSFKPTTTKLIFRFSYEDDIEPTTNQAYGLLLKNLTFIKTFASGILVPKTYIWPIDDNSYLEPHTSLVSDAHNEGLEVFTSEFYNDVPISYNYSYDPVSEYLNHIDNGEFSVDGVLSDFPSTASEAFDCFAHLGEGSGDGLPAKPKQSRPLVISRYGASGDFPGCTDLAYKKAISDGVDILDCPVQIAKDGTLFCSWSIDLTDTTTVLELGPSYPKKSIPELKANPGIYTFDFTWPEIKNLTPTISNPFSANTLFRNPKNKNSGKYMNLADFLALTKKTSTISGILLIIEHVAYLAKQSFDVIDKVIKALAEAGYGEKTAQNVLIQSSNSSVLRKFKEKSNYELVYRVEENVWDIPSSTVSEIKSFASAVVINKFSVFPDNYLLLVELTNVVSNLQSSQISVYVQLFSNEFISQAYDFYSDSTMEINTFSQTAKVDGIITEFPLTAARYKKNRCLNLGNNTPPYMDPAKPDTFLWHFTRDRYLPQSPAPSPYLTPSEVFEPPLPAVSKQVSPTPSKRPNGQTQTLPCHFCYNLPLLVAALFLLQHALY